MVEIDAAVVTDKDLRTLVKQLRTAFARERLKDFTAEDEEFLKLVKANGPILAERGKKAYWEPIRKAINAYRATSGKKLYTTLKGVQKRYDRLTERLHDRSHAHPRVVEESLKKLGMTREEWQAIRQDGKDNKPQC